MRKRKLITVLLTGACAVCLAFGLAACGDDGSSKYDQDIYSVYTAYAASAEDPLSYEDWLATIKGEQGDKGETGVGIVSTELAAADADGNSGTYLKVTYTDGSADYIDISSLSGEKGDEGDQGEQGIQGETGVGIVSTELATADADGNSGTYLKITYTDGSADYIDISSFSGEQGDEGERGDKGETGVGIVSTELATADADGNSGTYLKITYTDGSADYIDISSLSGEKGDEGGQGEQGIQGATGVGIVSTELATADADGNSGTYLKITYTDGSADYIDISSLSGEKGDEGGQGIQGETGVGIADISVAYGTDEDGDACWIFTFTMTDESVIEQQVKIPKTIDSIYYLKSEYVQVQEEAGVVPDDLYAYVMYTDGTYGYIQVTADMIDGEIDFTQEGWKEICLIWKDNSGYTNSCWFSVCIYSYAETEIFFSLSVDEVVMQDEDCVPSIYFYANNHTTYYCSDGTWWNYDYMMENGYLTDNMIANRNEVDFSVSGYQTLVILYGEEEYEFLIYVYDPADLVIRFVIGNTLMYDLAEYDEEGVKIYFDEVSALAIVFNYQTENSSNVLLSELYNQSVFEQYIFEYGCSGSDLWDYEMLEDVVWITENNTTYSISNYYFLINEVGIYTICGTYEGYKFVFNLIIYDSRIESDDKELLGFVCTAVASVYVGWTYEEDNYVTVSQIYYSNGEMDLISLIDGLTLDINEVDFNTAGSYYTYMIYYDTENEVNYIWRGVIVVEELNT